MRAVGALACEDFAFRTEERERAGLLVGDDAQRVGDDGERADRFFDGKRNVRGLRDDGEARMFPMARTGGRVYADDGGTVEKDVLGDAGDAQLQAVVEAHEGEVVRRGRSDGP
ncbi:MAG: hypothetical protein BWX86_02532 [Verrucomicrobia bacterium ADurb.Bin122]|nr:MAG: hypothetical protein BWX86_02532 [Verrucomicrobia bacterium ADurb.Bin122]